MGENLPEASTMLWALAIFIASLVLIEVSEARRTRVWESVITEDGLPQNIPPKYAVFLRLYELEDDVTKARMELRAKIEERIRTRPCAIGWLRRNVEDEVRLRASLHAKALVLERFQARTGLTAWQERVDIPQTWRDAWTS